MSSYPAYPHSSLYAPQTSAPPGIPSMPPGVSAPSLGLGGHPQHPAGIPLAHQGMAPPPDPTKLHHPGHNMAQHSQALPGHPAWCYLPPMSTSSILPVQPSEKDEKYNFGFTTTELEARIQKDAIDFAVNSAVSSVGRPQMNTMGQEMAQAQPPQVMPTDDSGQNMPVPTNPITTEPSVSAPAPDSPPPRPKPKVKKTKVGRSSSAKKRLRQPELWKKNVSKAKKIRGEAHVSRNGTFIPAKKVEEVDCSACSFKCNDHFTDELRNQLFDMFYSLGSNENQKQFVCQNVTEESTKPNIKNEVNDEGVRKENRRKVTRKYYLPDSDNSRKQCCSRFFRGTLCVGKSFITHALKHKQFGCYMGQEKRGKPHNKTPMDQLASARAHIESVLSLETKTGKKKSAKKKCAEKGLNVAKMYELYKNDCLMKGTSAVSLSIYRRVFQTEF